MSNGDEAMSPAEFAKLMGAYPEPAQNPLPAYGGYMDNSPANFAWVQNNDYFGAEEGQGKTYFITDLRWEVDDDPSNPRMGYVDNPEHTDETTEDEIFAIIAESVENSLAWRGNEVINATYEIKPLGYEDADYEQWKKENPNWDEDNLEYGAESGFVGTDIQTEIRNKIACPNCGEVGEDSDGLYMVGRVQCNNCNETFYADTDLTPTNHMNNSIGQVVPITNPMELPTNLIETEAGGGPEGQITPDVFSAEMPIYDINWDTDGEIIPEDGEGNELPRTVMVPSDLEEDEIADYLSDKYGWLVLGFGMGAETFEAPYGGAGSLMDIGKETPLADFTGKELAESSAIHGDFDQASLNYSGHQNLEVRAEFEDITENITEVKNIVDESVARIRIEDTEYDEDDNIVTEDVDITITDMDGNTLHHQTLDDSWQPPYDDYDRHLEAQNTKHNWFLYGSSLVIGTLAFLNKDRLKDVFKMAENRIFNNETQDMLENDPELIESPNTGNLDPAQYEEMVVESTGYAVDVIPMGLDGSFMGSRFAALPTERYVEYNDPGIGAHTDIALNRDEVYLEPEMAMVQAAEEGNVVKEAQAPGQSPYLSVDGQEPKDFNYRVLKETHPVSLDPAVKPFIPQSMSGYTGNANTPPSVLNKMFNIGVLGQTPAFVAGSTDMGANHFGSRDAKPNMLGIGGSVGGPLSDQVNANYTDGNTSMSLAQWSIENTVSQTSDTEAIVIDRSSGQMKRVRRV